MVDVTAQETGGGGLGTQAARWCFVFVWACGVVTGWTTNSLPPTTLVNVSGYAAGLAGAWLVTTPGAFPLSRSRAAWVPPIALYVTVVALLASPPIGNMAVLNFSAFLVTFLIARGNPVAGSVGSALVVGYALAWALPQAPSGHELAVLLGIPVGSIVAGVVWRQVLRHIVRRERAHRGTAQRAVVEAAAADAALAASRDELDHVHHLLAEILTQIHDGHPIDDQFRSRIVHAEATVRDRIHAPHLQQPDLVAEFARLREDGVSVVVLGEPAHPGEQISAQLANRIVHVTSQVQDGRVTVRTLPPNRLAAVSVVIQTDGTSHQVLFSNEGKELARN